MAIQAFLQKQETSQVNNLTYHLKELEKGKKKAKGQSQQKERNNKYQKGNRDQKRKDQ